MFKSHSGTRVALCPEDGDHFAERSYPRTFRSGANDQALNQFNEELIIGPVFLYHERRKRNIRQ